KMSLILSAEEIITIDLGIAIEVPEKHIMQLASRSSLAKKGITVKRGVVDAGYI
ncbi:5191_t:CDS:1, partial [Ambispora gerdemannii]